MKKTTSKGTANAINPSAKREIYALLGVKNCGKTTTIKEIYRILSIKYPNCIIPRTKKYGYDMKIEMQIKAYRVGINSSGDIKPSIKSCLDDFAKKGCNIIFCVESLSNPNQQQNTTVVSQWVNSHPSYKLIPIPQNTVIKKNSTQANANYEYAEKIIKKAGL